MNWIIEKKEPQIWNWQQSKTHYWQSRDAWLACHSLPATAGLSASQTLTAFSIFSSSFFTFSPPSVYDWGHVRLTLPTTYPTKHLPNLRATKSVDRWIYAVKKTQIIAFWASKIANSSVGYYSLAGRGSLWRRQERQSLVKMVTQIHWVYFFSAKREKGEKRWRERERGEEKREKWSFGHGGKREREKMEEEVKEERKRKKKKRKRKVELGKPCSKDWRSTT